MLVYAITTSSLDIGNGSCLPLNIMDFHWLTADGLTHSPPYKLMLASGWLSFDSFSANLHVLNLILGHPPTTCLQTKNSR